MVAVKHPHPASEETAAATPKSGPKLPRPTGSDNAARQLEAAGATPLQGDVNDYELLRRGAAESEAVIHTAFNHDFSQFKASCEADRKVIEALGDAAQIV